MIEMRMHCVKIKVGANCFIGHKPATKSFFWIDNVKSWKRQKCAAKQCCWCISLEIDLVKAEKFLHAPHQLTTYDEGVIMYYVLSIWLGYSNIVGKYWIKASGHYFLVCTVKTSNIMNCKSFFILAIVRTEQKDLRIHKGKCLVFAWLVKNF